MRSQKSCNKLKTSFLELLSQSDGLPIRMTELLKLAGVSKTTFYVYYENLDQLAFDLIERTASGAKCSSAFAEKKRRGRKRIRGADSMDRAALGVAPSFESF